MAAHCSRVLFAALALAAALPSGAQERVDREKRDMSIGAETAAPGGVKRPYVEIGDCWAYRTENMNNKGPIGEYNMCVSLVDPSKNVILAVATRKSDGREFDVSFDTAWNPRTSIMGFIIAGDARFLRFPADVGDTYSFEYETRRPNEIQVLGRSTYNVKVVGWEDVTVPAGRFRALKVQGEGTGFSSGQSWPQSFTIWYVPEVNNVVKTFVRHRAGFHWGEELVGYRLNQ
jgi:hypothetical protein